jgi:hypothetical protein
MAAKNVPVWGDPGVTELLALQETPIVMPGANGGPATRTLQRAGLLKRLRFFAMAHANVTVHAGAAETRSPYGALGSFINNISVTANGQIPLVQLSGLGALVYNEIENRDGSVLALKAYEATAFVVPSPSMVVFDDIGAAAIGDFFLSYPFEFQFALPFAIAQSVQELGLWLLQNQAIDVGITINFNPLIQTVASNDAPWSGVAATYTPTLADCQVLIERELYNLPNDPGSYPNMMWAHQIIEFVVPFTGNFSRFSIPRAGLLLRVIVINLAAASGATIVNTDITTLSYIYGSNETPISRPGWAWNAEYVMDYGRLPPRGVVVLDFYKFGGDGLKMVKSTEDLANLRIETRFLATATGSQRIILDRLIPVSAR